MRPELIMIIIGAVMSLAGAILCLDLIRKLLAENRVLKERLEKLKLDLQALRNRVKADSDYYCASLRTLERMRGSARGKDKCLK